MRMPMVFLCRTAGCKGRLLLDNLPATHDIVITQASQWQRCFTSQGASTTTTETSSNLLATSRRRCRANTPAPSLSRNISDLSGLSPGAHAFASASANLTRGFASAAAKATQLATPSTGLGQAAPAQPGSGSNNLAPWPWVDPARPQILPVSIVQTHLEPVPLKTALQQLLEPLTSAQRASHSLEVCARFLLDPRRSDHLIRGSVPLPYGTGKAIRLVVFASGDDAEIARAEGVDFIGDEELINTLVSRGESAITFDKLIATPDFMRALAKAGKILGPKGLMPNPKMGTLTNDVAGAIREIRRGRLDYRLGRDACIRVMVGRAAMPLHHLEAHVGGLVASLLENKPKVIMTPGEVAAAAGGAGAGERVLSTAMLEGYIRNFLVKTSQSSSMPISFDSLIEAAKKYRSMSGGGVTEVSSGRDQQGSNTPAAT